MRNDNMYEPAFARKENETMNDMNMIKIKDFKTLTYLKIAALSVSTLAAIGVPIGLAVAAANNDNYLVPLVAMIVFILIFLLLDVSSVKSESEIHHDNVKPEPNVNENCKQELQKSHEQLHHIYEEYDGLRPDLPHREALAQLHILDCALDDIKKELNAIEAKYSDPWSVDQLELENSFLNQIRDYVDDCRFKVISRTLLEAVLADEKFPVYLEACASSILEKTLQNLERISETGFLYPKVCRLLKDDGQQISVFSVLESKRVVGDEVLTIAPPHACWSIIYYDLAGNIVSTVTTWTTGPFASLTDDLIIVHEGYRKRQMRETLSMDGEELDIDSRDTIDNTIASLRKRLATLTARQS